MKMRLGLLKTRDDERRNAPSVEELLTFFEVTVVGFWQIQAAMGSSESAEVSRLRAASRIYDAALLLFHERDAPIPLEVMTKLLSRRLDREFRNSNLARDVLLDDGDEPLRVAEWLARPDDSAVDRGFREEIQYRYPDHFEAFADTNHVPDWIHVLGLSIPFTSAQLRDAYRTRSRTMHPDAGGSHDQFVRLNHAYETARQYLRG